MKILFSMRHSGAIRNFEATIRRLAERGHSVHLSFAIRDKIGDDRMKVGTESIVTRLTSEVPQVSYSVLTKRSDATSFWYGFARKLRYFADATRYRLPSYDGADALRERAEERLPGSARWLIKGPWFRWPWFNRLASSFFGVVDWAIPIDPLIAADLEETAPDLVLITPLLDIGSDQVDYVKAARARGIPSALCVHSWDNLTNKGIVRIRPDRIFVWNEAQRIEAIEHHHAAPETVVATGAHTYDHWFAWRPSREAAEFKQLVGLDPALPYVLYLGSSRFIAPDEIEFVERWAMAVRRFSGSDSLANVGILIRPHPENPQPWERLDELDLGNITVWPRGGANPVLDELRADYFDSIYHCRAVVGINTSGMIEAGILGRETFTILDPDYQRTQGGTIHFHLLTDVGEGLLQVAPDFGVHAAQLADGLQDPTRGAERVRGFVREFIRPRGLDLAAADLLADDIEALAADGCGEPRGPGVSAAIVRVAVAPFALLMSGGERIRRRVKKRKRSSSSTVGWLISTPRKLSLRALLLVLKIRSVRSFVRKYVVPRVASGGSARPIAARAEREVRRLRDSGRTILVGPWLGEVGFEVLYWVPFVNWVREAHGIPPERFIVVSRGGVASWYANVTDRYLEMLDYMTSEHYLYNNLRRVHRGKQKQRQLGEFDREIVRIVKDVTKEDQLEILHPALLYDLFMTYWKREASVRLADEFSEFRRPAVPDVPELRQILPDEYVAVRFYFNDSFPDTSANREFARDTVLSLAERTDVAVLNPGFSMDEHSDLEFAANPRIHTVEHLMTPSNNLAVQSAVVAGARAFVGTYGGLSYLPPLYGIDSLAFYSEADGFHYHHLEFAEYVFSRRFDGGRFIALDTGDTELLGLALGDHAGVRP